MRRILFAAFLSASIIAGTQWWYHYSMKATNNSHYDHPIAFAQQLNHDVHRKASDKLIWYPLKEWDPIYSGESIKTSGDAEIRIQFTDGHRYIDMEPDTLIVLKQEDQQTHVDLRDGSIFVTAANEENNFVVQSGQQNIEIGQATVQLSKNKDKTDVQVLKGKIKLDNKGQVKEINAGVKTTGVEILSPPIDQAYFVNPDFIEPIQFKWKGFLAGTQVSLWVGKNRKDLQETSAPKGANADAIPYRLPVGKHYFQLVATDPATEQVLQKSPVYRLEITPRYAPAILAPLPNSFLQKDPLSPNVDFKWNTPEGTQSVSIEIGTDPDLRNKVVYQNLGVTSLFKQNLKEGEYYWRVSSNYPGINKPISTAIMKFSLSSKPKVEEKIRLPVAIQWIHPMDRATQNYLNEPIANLGWTSTEKQQVRLWRIKISDDLKILQEDRTEEMKVVTTQDLNAKIPLKKEGSYLAVVEALDEKQQVLAKSSIKEFRLLPLPALPAPELLPKDVEFQGDNQGRVKITWKRVPGAQEYWITLYTQEGREISTRIDKNKDIEINTLLPGTHKIDIYAIDSNGRKSQRKTARTIKIPDGSNIRAPTGIRIKK